MRSLTVLFTLYFCCLHRILGQDCIVHNWRKFYRTSISSGNSSGNDPIDYKWTEKSFHITNHDAADFGVIGTEIPGKFDATKALFKLFPGRQLYLTDDDDAKWFYSVAVWRAPLMPKHWAKDGGVEHWFPGKTGNFTKVHEVLHFKNDSGKQFVYVVFEHNETTALDALYCGVACGADAGIALFAQQGEKWVLTHFSLYAGTYGRYKKLTARPKVIKLGKDNYGLELFSPVSGPGGPSFGETFLYAPVGHTIKLVYSDRSSAVWDFNGRCSRWFTSLVPQHGTNQFNDLKVVVSGDYCLPSMAGGIFDDDSIGTAPDEVFFKTSVADSFGYKITRLYRHDGNEYKWQRTFYRTYAVKPKKKN